ncbi:hypothetical protein L579_3373 [Pantoea sp. AS-PWVM4]|nr:hypothetical protein L579_3373 [Pantoea sp. AS-PWVM4]
MLAFAAVIRTIRGILFACWLMPAGAVPSFIANQMGFENAQRVYQINATGIEEMNSKQVKILNATVAW